MIDSIEQSDQERIQHWYTRSVENYQGHKGHNWHHPDLDASGWPTKEIPGYWADAKIEGNKVIVWSDEVNNPIAVRYAWADNTEDANLYNAEGLPASPFRTDDWITED